MRSVRGTGSASIGELRRGEDAAKWTRAEE